MRSVHYLFIYLFIISVINIQTMTFYARTCGNIIDTSVLIQE